MYRSLLAAVALIAAIPATAQSVTGWRPDEAALRAHVRFLASDGMNGREAGSRDYDVAAAYVAAQFEAMGLKPAGGNDRYLQHVPLITYGSTDEGSVELLRGGSADRLIFGDDYLPGNNPLPEVARTAPLVFAGYGIVAPRYGRDDYAGLDVRGKIVVVLAAGPATIQTEERAHYGNVLTKQALAASKGAIGVITVTTPSREKAAPFANSLRTWKQTRAGWATADGSPSTPGLAAPALATLSMAGARKLFAGVPGGGDRLIESAEKGRRLPKALTLPAARISVRSTVTRVASANVAGLLEGSDPALRHETVVLSAHLDHLGPCPAIAGDTICNGAMDNAVGIASLIEVAHGFKHLGVRPKRSILFLAVTAEEKGLVGSDYFANNPTLPKRDLIANVNLDMPIITYDFTDVVAFGAERSGMGPIVKRAAASLGLTLTPDPEPDQGLFTRSDHYRFVQQGIPAVFLKTGPANGGEAASTLFRTTHYHKPSDDMSLPFRWDAGAKFVALNLAITRELADAPARPMWNKGDFFGTLFGGVGAN